MDIPMPPVVQPRTIIDYANDAANYRTNRQQGDLNQIKLDRAPQQMAMEDQKAQMESEQAQMVQGTQKQAALKGLATDFKTRLQAAKITDPALAQQYLDQYVKAHEPYIKSMGFPMSEKFTLQQVEQIAGATPTEQNQAEIQHEVAKKEALAKYEHDYVPMQSPGGGVDFYDKKHPNVGGVPAQPMGAQQPQVQMQSQQGVQQQPAQGVNIFNPQPQNQFSPKSQQVQQEENIKLNSEEQKKAIEQKAKQDAADIAFMQSEPEKLASLNKQAFNLQGLGENLNKYGEQVKKDFLPTDNSIAYNARQILGSDTVLNDITQANGQIMVDTMRSMKQDSGVSPSQLMNTEKEWERQLAAATGTGTVQSRKNAWEKLTRDLHQTYNSYEKTRAEIYKRQKKEYKPLMSANMLPGHNVIDADTNNMPIGQVGTLNGKKIRVIGQNQIEVID